MSVRFVLGRSGSGKSAFMMDEIIGKMKEDPWGRPIFYIVPDQMSFLTEYEFASRTEIRGMVRTQIYSFTRLAWRVLQETGGANRIHIHSTGIAMLIRKIINENREKLKIFRKNADKFGFIRQMENLLTEFKRYLIAPGELADVGGSGDLGQNLLDKLHDLHIIYREFTEVLKNKYTAADDYLTLLSENIKDSEILRDSEVYLDGFYRFTPQEYAVIEQLMKHCARVTVALTLDRPCRDRIPDELDLFRMTGETYGTLYEMAAVNGVPVEDDLVFGETLRFRSPGLKYLEAHFEELPPPPFPEKPDLAIMEAANIRAEVEGVARKIIALARDGGYRFKDMAILLRNSPAYLELIETIFKDYRIPFYIDQKKMMLNHPLIEFIRSVLEIVTRNWPHEAVFRAVKTDFLFPKGANLPALREQMDVLENYCLSHGIQGKRWTEDTPFRYRRYRGIDDFSVQTDEEKELENRLNEWRNMITAPIIRLEKRMRRAANGRELCEALYLFLEDLDVPEKLEMLRKDAESSGELRLSREHEQVWPAVIDLLDQFVEVLGDERMSPEDFAETIDSGLESLRFSTVPPALDQVIVADLELSRLADVKIAFLIGLNDGILPAKFSEEGILSDDDREQLSARGLKNAPTGKERLLDEEFIAYKAFTTPSERLYLSYPIADEEGKALLPSPYIKRMKEMFPKVREIPLKSEPNECPEAEQPDYIVNFDIALFHLTNELERYKRRYPVAPLWWDCYNLIMESGHKEAAKAVLSSLFYENKAKKLSPDTVRDLYGDKLYGSITRMELYNSCPYAHFLTHGLRLEKREIFKLELPDIGQLYHAALKEIGEKVRSMDRTWGSLSLGELEQIVKETVQRLAPKLQHEILFSSNRYQYLKRKFEKILLRSVKVLREHAKASVFEPIGLEIAFGPKGDLPPVRYRLKNGMSLELVGRIDRVDKAETDRGVFLRIIDYKSGTRALDLGEVYYGLALQMLTYLDVLLSYSEMLVGKPAKPAGVFYFRVHNPSVRSGKPLSDEEIEREIFKKYKMAGLALSDPEIIKAMDQTLTSGESQIIAAGIKRDGRLTARSKTADEEEFSVMRQYVRRVFQKTGEAIAEGSVDIAPYKMNGETPCQYCPFHPVCQFDQRLGENRFRVLTPLKQDEAMAFMKREVADQ